MVNIDELKETELKQIEEDYSELAELERLIVDGANVKIPYIVNYPKYNEKTKEIEYTKVTVKLSPVTNIDWNNATNITQNNDATIKIVSKGLFTKNGEPFPLKLIRLMPSGVVNTIFKEIARISGVELNSKENVELMKELMGF